MIEDVEACISEQVEKLDVEIENHIKELTRLRGLRTGLKRILRTSLNRSEEDKR